MKEKNEKKSWKKYYGDYMERTERKTKNGNVKKTIEKQITKHINDKSDKDIKKIRHTNNISVRIV